MCLVTRAVHLELTHCQSGESDKRSVENFINRRGRPHSIKSDNGTNFIWTSHNYLDGTGKPLNWKFIPPAAPSQGGAWERLVRSVKRALSQMEIPDNMDDEQLQNFLIKAEAIINSRPLTEISAGPGEPALTPNHFLMGSSSCSKEEEEENRFDAEEASKRLLEGHKENTRLLRHFWDRWTKEYLPLIAARPKWKRKVQQLEPGDLVFIVEPSGWIRGVIEETLVDPETDQVREATIKTGKKTYRRPASKIARIDVPKVREDANDKQPGPLTRGRAKVQNELNQQR